MITHYPGCNANYPEKPEGEKPQQIAELDIGDGETVLQCVDCGAFEVKPAAIPLPNTQATEDIPYGDGYGSGE